MMLIHEEIGLVRRRLASGVLLLLAAAFVIVQAGCSDDGDRCARRIVELDPLEPDDSPETASALLPGVDQSRTIHCAGGEFNDDFVFLQTQPGRVYTRPTIVLVQGEEPSIAYLGPTGAELSYFAEYGDGGVWLAPESGRYSLRLSAGFSTNILGDRLWDTARYGIRFDEVDGDAFEPDDTLATASEIASGVMQEHTLTYYADVDTMRFTVATGTRVLVFLPPDQLSSSIVPIVSIRSGAGDDVAAGAPGWDISAGGTWTAAADGIYYVTVANDSTGSRFVGPKPYKIAATYPF